jgi:DNA invertase Pin-like site-specific DNA recombinase
MKKNAILYTRVSTDEQNNGYSPADQKVLLAIYLTTPEVDNDRRALNIFHGIRRARKEGRWMGSRPLGYRNARDQFNKPVIVPEGGLQEELVKQTSSISDSFIPLFPSGLVTH